MDPLSQPADDATVTVLDQVHWRNLADAHALDVYAAAWLALQCRLLERPRRAVLVLRDAATLAPAARWPAGDAGSPGLAAIAEMALQQRRGVATRLDGGSAAEDSRPSHLALPILRDGEVEGVVAVEMLGEAGSGSLRETMRQLQWGVSWIELFARRAGQRADARRLGQSVGALEATASALSAENFTDAARGVATELAVRLGAMRVAIGWERRHGLRVVGLSHAVELGRRASLAHDLVGAMQEASDRAATLLYPIEGRAGEGRRPALRAHLALAERHGAGTVLTTPMTAAGQIVGAITVEQDSAAAIGQDQVDLVEAVAALVGPALWQMARGERWLGAVALDGARRTGRQLLGREQYGLKLAALAGAALIAFFALCSTEYRVTAHAAVEGAVRRSVAASLDGYVASEHVRAGQVVRRGEVLATLDAVDLNLQRLRWIAEREQHRLERERALAAGQRAEVAIDAAQVSEADAEIAVLDEEIARTTIVAPFDGLVVSGDLSQSVGVPVQRAQVLFELAPLDAYRVVIRVPDSDIGRVVPGQHGSLVLTALPDERMPLTVRAVTPVAEQFEGGNGFRVEATLDQVSERLRPNMEGVAKLSAGRHLLIWIWTHHAIDAVRLWLWSWWP